MSRIPDRLPAPLSERLGLASQAVFSRMGREVDVAIGGIPFMLATSADVPQSVETIPQRKDQFDTERDPGEQSLSGWWRRSQSSFHQGAGFLYEPNSDDAHNGYWDSEGVEVFNQNELTLLPGVSQIGSANWSRLRPYQVSYTRTNLCTNPSFETSTAGWTNDANCTIARSTTRSHVGTASLAVTSVGGTNTWKVTVPLAAGSSGPYGYSAYVYVPPGAPRVMLKSNGVVASTGTTTGSFVRPALRTTGTLELTIETVTPPPAGTVYYIDAVLVESGLVVGSYFDGDFTPDCAWTGTTNLSTSTMTIDSGQRIWSGVVAGTLRDGTASTWIHAPGGKTIVDGLVSGSSFYDIASDGTLYQGSTSNPSMATSWPCGSSTSRIMWGKHRLWVIGGRSIWQPDLTLAASTAQTPVFTHPNLGWTYTCMAEGPGAMLFAGNDGHTSSIQAISFDSGGGIPTLTGATVTAIMPDGELIQEIAVIAGQFIGIGTTAGFRVGKIENDQITYGPVMLSPDGIRGTTALATERRFFLVAFDTEDGRSQVYKVDTATEVEPGVYAYAKDMQCADYAIEGDTPDKGAITSIAAIEGGLLAATNPGLWQERTDGARVESGWLETSRIRFRTTEPKAFKFLDLDIEPLRGDIVVDSIIEGGSVLPIGSYTKQGEVAMFSLLLAPAPQRYMGLKFTLMRDATLKLTPNLHSFLMRAVPAVAPQRLITLPLMCFDQEQARSGQRYGGDGYSADRLAALQLLENGGQTLVFQDFSTGPGNTGQSVMIESIRYVQTAPRDSISGNQGGILYLQLRTIDM